MHMRIHVHGRAHVYYAYPLLVNETETGVSRGKIFNALTYEGVPALGDRYVNLHLYPIYQKKIAYGCRIGNANIKLNSFRNIYDW